MIRLTFKEFITDYQNYYNCKDFYIHDLNEFEDVIYDLYDRCNGFDINYETKTIEIY